MGEVGKGCPTLRLLGMFWSSKTVKTVHIFITVVFAVYTFIVSVREIARFEKQFRRRQPKSVDVEAIGRRKLLFPDASRDSGYKSIAWLNSPTWLPRKSSEVMFRWCDVSQCTISYDRSDVRSANAVIVNGFDISDTLPPPRSPNQLYVFFSFEPPVYTNISQTWRYVFNWTLTYRTDSDIWRPYGDLRRNRTKVNMKVYKDILKRKTKAVAWFVSRCKSQSKRERYVRELSKHVQIDVYGKCGPHKCGDACYEKLKEYRFFLAFENALCTDYVTEKFFKTFKYDVIPVVRGGANYSALYGDGFLINTADFSSIESLGKYLRYLMSQDDEYIRLLQNKHKYFAAFPMPWCELCEKLYNADSYRKRYDIHEWLHRGSCTIPTDLRHKTELRLKTPRRISPG